MRLYIACDDLYRSRGEWLVGVSKSSPDKIKDEIGLRKKNSCVDVFLDSPQAREILMMFIDKFECAQFGTNPDVVIVQGHHSGLANHLMALVKEYNDKHPSLKRSFSKWLGKIESWEKSPLAF